MAAQEAVPAVRAAIQQLADLVVNVEVNRMQCQRLANRAARIGVHLDQLAASGGLNIVALKLLEARLLECQEQVRLFGTDNWLKRVVDVGTDPATFQRLNQQLADAVRLLNSDIQVGELFNDTEDLDDRNQDFAILSSRDEEIAQKLASVEGPLVAQYPDFQQRTTVVRNLFRQTLANLTARQPKEQREAADSLLEGFIVPWEELKLEKRLGGGAFGEVHLGWWRTDRVAIKVLKGGDSKDFMNELKLMAKLRHPNVIQLMAVCLDTGHNALVMEYMQRGSLFDVLADRRIDLDWQKRFRIASDVAKGMAYLVGQKILHRDLKSPNVMLREDLGAAKICDFGLSKMLNAKATDVVGSVRWIAPELFGLKPNTEASDIYAFGMVLYELATRRLPFSELNDEQVEAAVVKGERPVIPMDVPKGYADIIRACWDQDPAKRPTFEKIVRDQWLEPAGTPPSSMPLPAPYIPPRLVAPTLGPTYYTPTFYNPNAFPMAGPKVPPRNESRSIPITVPQRSVSLAPGAMPRTASLAGPVVGRVPLPNYRGAECRVVSVEVPGLVVGQRLVLQDAWSDQTARGMDPQTGRIYDFPLRSVIFITQQPQQQYGMPLPGYAMGSQLAVPQYQQYQQPKYQP